MLRNADWYGLDEDGKIKYNSFLWWAVYSSSNLSKTRLEEISCEKIIKEAKEKNLTLQSTALIVIALSKIHKKKTNYILDECKRFLKVVNGKLKPANKIKAPKQKRKMATNINSSIMDEEAFKQTTLDISMHEGQTGNYESLNGDFFLEPEMVRNSKTSDLTGVQENQSSIFNSTRTSETKRIQKVINDKTTEMKIEDARKKMELVMKRDKTNAELSSLKETKMVIEHFSRELFMDPAILAALKREIDAFNAEVVRNSAVAADYEMGCFETGPVDFEMNNDISNLSVKFDEIEEDFNLTEALSTLPREEQAKLFFELLNVLSKNSHTATQKSPYEHILVTKNFS